MDLSPSPFWLKNKQHQASVFDFTNIPVEHNTNEENDDDETSEFLIGKICVLKLINF
jgi:glutaredoxin 2